jgi:hypothetical protein
MSYLSWNFELSKIETIWFSNFFKLMSYLNLWVFLCFQFRAIYLYVGLLQVLMFFATCELDVIFELYALFELCELE